MTSEQMQAHKTRMKKLKTATRAKRQLAGLPLLEHFELSKNDISLLTVTELLSDDEFTTEVLQFGSLKSKFAITQIKCPCCDDALQFDKRWEAFYCRECNKRFEITAVHSADSAVIA